MVAIGGNAGTANNIPTTAVKIISITTFDLHRFK
jgi:hypothetical protein